MSGPRRAPWSSMASAAPGQPIAGRRRTRGSRWGTAGPGGRLPSWWPLAALVILAAAARLSTLSLQSFWYDEAYTPVHVLHTSLVATLRSVVASENTPPLWYGLEWAISRVLGTGVVALRLLSALAGLGVVGVGWAIGAQLGSRRTAVILAAILAVNPLFVWYSQEARAYELYAFASAVSLLFFLRAYRSLGPRALALWSASSVLALLSHYFAVFLVGPEALLLLARLLPARGPSVHPWLAGTAGTPTTQPAARARAAATRPTFVALATVTVCGAALLPLVIAQAGRGTQWIGRWALSDRLVRIPGYYLLAANGSVLGRGLLALSALPLLAALALGCALLAKARLRRTEIDAIGLMLGLGIVAILIPLALALAGADYLAPRNLIADWIPLSAALALVLGAGAAGRAGILLTTVVCLGAATVVVATDLDPRLQRPDWRAVANVLRPGTADRVIVSVEDGAAPLEYYLPHLGLRYLSRRLRVSVSEVDLVGYAPVRRGAIRPPTRAFALIRRADIHGLLVYRYTAGTPQRLSGRFLRSLTPTVGAAATAEALLPASIPTARR